jgi:hypothetical protein
MLRHVADFTLCFQRLSNSPENSTQHERNMRRGFWRFLLRLAKHRKSKVASLRGGRSGLWTRRSSAGCIHRSWRRRQTRTNRTESSTQSVRGRVMPVSKSKQRSHRQSETRRNKPRQPAPITNDNDTPVWGAKAIGRVIGKSERAAFHLLESKALRGAKKIRGTWSAIPSVLRAQWETGEVGGE